MLAQPLKLAFTDEVKPYLPEPLKDWAEVTRLGEKLEKFGCCVKTQTAIERHGLTDEETTYIEIWRPINRSLDDLAREYEAQKVIH